MKGTLTGPQWGMKFPWLTLMTAPVIPREASLSRNTIVSAGSSGSIQRPPRSVVAISSSSAGLLIRNVDSDAVWPGAMTFTRIPCGASSEAIPRLRATTAPLVDP